jgi:hypothetical protein
MILGSAAATHLTLIVWCKDCPQAYGHFDFPAETG